MYDMVYQLMIEAGVARKLEQPVRFCNDGSIGVEGDINVVGLSSNIELLHPQYVVFVDETGSNTNMRTDGQRGRQRVIAESGFDGHQEAIVTDLRYTTMGFTCATGEPILCVVIFQSENKDGIPKAWVTGLDIMKIKQDMGDLDDDQFMQTISTEGSPAGGGPVCIFRGKHVPCLLQYSPHGGITGPILTNCLKYMDELQIFDRSGNINPFLLLDGHCSRYHIEFLQYIRDKQHPWIVAIGLPYATHIWQVGDSKEQNGSYKRVESEAKDELLIEKRKRNLPVTLRDF